MVSHVTIILLAYWHLNSGKCPGGTLLRHTAFIIFIILLWGNTFAQEMEGAKVLAVSGSKKSILLDFGHEEGLKNGDRAKLYIKDISGGLSYPKVFYVGEGEAIKVKNKVSYWFLRKIKNFRLLKKDQMLGMVRQGQDPRRPFVTRRVLQVQGRKNEQDYYQVNSAEQPPEDLIFEEGDFVISNKVSPGKALKRSDIDLQRNALYLDLGEELDEEFDQVVRKKQVPNYDSDEELIKQIEKEKEDGVFDSASRKSVEKYNKLKYGLKGLYGQNLRGNDKNTPDTGFYNTRENDVLNDQEARKLDPVLVKKMDREGVRWSQSMSDENLRKALVQSGIREELQRQKRVLGEKKGSEFTLRYITGLNDNTTQDDPNFQGKDYALSISYEWHLGRTLESLNYFTFEIEAERGISHYAIREDINGRVSEGSFKGCINWYLFRPPYSLFSYMPYVGIGFKSGNGDLESAEFDSTYSVQFSSVPYAHAGLKYRFQAGDEKDLALRVGYGINFQLRYESISYTISDVVVDNIDTTFQTNNLKLGVGLNVYF